LFFHDDFDANIKSLSLLKKHKKSIDQFERERDCSHLWEKWSKVIFQKFSASKTGPIFKTTIFAF